MSDLQAAIDALREIAEITRKQQLPITAQIHRIAAETLDAVGRPLPRRLSRNG